MGVSDFASKPLITSPILTFLLSVFPFGILYTSFHIIFIVSPGYIQSAFQVYFHHSNLVSHLIWFSEEVISLILLISASVSPETIVNHLCKLFVI
jgi:hypothetical protein